MARRPRHTGRDTGTTPTPEELAAEGGGAELTPTELAQQRNLDSRAQMERTRAAKEAEQSFELAAGVSEEINAKVKGLLGGQEALGKIQALGEENEEYANFYERNKEAFEKIMTMNLKGTYEALKVNAANREQLYKKLVDDHVLTKEELNNFQGVVSTEKLFVYLQTLSPGQRVREGAVDLSKDDFDNLAKADYEDMPALLGRLKADNKINDEEAAKLTALGPKTPDQIDTARHFVQTRLTAYDRTNRTSYSKAFQRFYENEQKIGQEFDKYIERYNQLVKGLVEQIQEQFDQHQQNLIKEKNKRLLAKETGINIHKGQVLWAMEIVNGQAGTEKNRRIEIEDIAFAGVEVDKDLPEDSQILKPTFEPIIHFTATPNGGQKEELQMSATQFKKWVLENQVTEKFETPEELAKELSIVEFLKPGQSLNYFDSTKSRTAPTAEEDGETAGSDIEATEANTYTVTIVKIENGKVYLDHPVRIDAAVPGTTKTTPTESAEIEFGDFARWYRKYVCVPEVSELDELDDLLEQHHHRLLADMNWPEDHGAPISINDGPFPQYVISAYSNHPESTALEITGVNDDGLIETAAGDKLKPHDFYRAVVEQGLTRPTPEQLKTLKEIADAKRDTKSAGKLEEIAAKPDNPPDSTTAADSAPQAIGGKTGWERLKEFWGNTQILSLMDIYQLFIKAPKERVQEWLKDRTERRQYAVGKEFYKNFPKFGGLNDLSDSFEDKLNGKNATDVKNTEEYFDKNCTVKDVFDKLYVAPNKNTLKACLQFLSKKGQLRWEDDEKLWAILNKHLAGAFYPEKFHHQLNNKRYLVTVGDKEVKRLAPNIDVFDQCRALLDGGWGAGTWDSISSANEQQYQNKKKETADKMHAEYEYRGGIGKALQKMLYEWQNDVDVKEAEFDGLLSQAILKGEINAEQGVFLLICAFGQKNKKGQGRTILSNARLNSYIPYLAKHQMFFFFANNHYELDEKGEIVMETVDGKRQPKPSKFRHNNFSKVFRDVIQKDIAATGKTDFEQFKAGKNTIDWMSKNMLTDKVVKLKMQENAGSNDIDVLYYQHLGPLIKQENLHRVLRSGYNSLGKPEVLKNMYAGYNHQLALKAQLLNTGYDDAAKDTRAEEFADMVNGFIYFNNVLRERIERDNKQNMRITETMLESAPLADKKRRTIEFCSETEQFMADFAVRIARLTSDAELEEMSNAILHSGTSALNDAAEQKFRGRLHKRILELNTTQPQVLAEEARKAASVLKGMSGAQLTKEEMEKAKATT